MSRRRYLRSVALGVVFAALVLAGVAVWQVGLDQARSSLAQRLDNWHILGPKTRTLHEALRLEKANPVLDAQQAMRAGNTKLLGVACPKVEVPGVDAPLRAKLGVRIILMGSLDWPEYKQYRVAALRYAETYNRAMSQAVSR